MDSVVLLRLYTLRAHKSKQDTTDSYDKKMLNQQLQNFNSVYTSSVIKPFFKAGLL